MIHNTTNATWGGWNQDYQLRLTVSTTTAGTWTAWNTGYTNASTATTTGATDVTIWNNWNSNANAIARAVGVPRIERNLTPDQLVEREARLARERDERARQQEINRARYAEERAKRSAAEDRAEQLLHSMLSEQQIHMLTKDGKFLVEVNEGRVYEIRRGRAHNVFLLGADGKPIQELCAHVRPNIPDADNMLAQMLQLMVNEDEYRRVANIWQLLNGGAKDYRAVSNSGSPCPAPRIAA